ncbi:MAG TPA: choice-of-anchor B family protein [Solirubrobacter sp.]|nr:choice-of-anchor B family protein [Solirubrobacter sp.]
MKLRVLLAAGVGVLVFAGTASAHPTGGVFGTGLSMRWFDTDGSKIRDLMRVQPPQSAKPQTQAPCVSGKAREFACQNIDLLAHLPLASIGGGEIGNDMWGWKDPLTRREYALVGKTNGTAFVDITQPRKPVYLGQLPTQSTAGGIFWRDIKVYKNHAFVVSENTGHGMQVFDLTRLRNVSNAPATFTADAVYTGVSNTHNLDINEDSGFAYLVGTNTCGSGNENGGLHMVDIREPKSPRFAGCATVPAGQPNNNYVHDTQCVNYRGPDKRFRGREICFGSNENAVVIYDVTDKSNPVVLSQTTYPTAVYTHQGWLTPDSKWFVFNDEGDEEGFGGAPTVGRQTTYILNVEDLVKTGEVRASPNNTTSIDHNLYMPGDGYIYESNYTSGLRIFTEKSVPGGKLQEVAWFDLYPENDNASFEGGTWSNYAWFDHGVVGVNSIDRGLFLLNPKLK